MFRFAIMLAALVALGLTVASDVDACGRRFVVRQRVVAPAVQVVQPFAVQGAFVQRQVIRRPLFRPRTTIIRQRVVAPAAVVSPVIAPQPLFFY